MKALHSLTNSCDFADLKFRLAEMRGTYHFGALSMGYVSFWRPYTGKKPLLSTTTKGVFLLFYEVDYGIISATNRKLVKIQNTRSDCNATRANFLSWKYL